MGYLTKIIEVVSICTGEPEPAKPLKVGAVQCGSARALALLPAGPVAMRLGREQSTLRSACLAGFRVILILGVIPLLQIVAGLEPESTNAFLQLLGQAARQGDGVAAVQQVLGGQASPAAAPAPPARAQPAAAACRP